MVFGGVKCKEGRNAGAVASWLLGVGAPLGAVQSKPHLKPNNVAH
jgi:hypothetical protein